MESELSLERIMAAHTENRKNIAEQLSILLQKRTKRALELDLFGDEIKKHVLPGVELSKETRESILLATPCPSERVKEGLDVTLTNVVLRKDGGLYTLEVLEKTSLGDGDVEKKGTLKEEIVDSDLLIGYAPQFIKTLEKLIWFAE